MEKYKLLNEVGLPLQATWSPSQIRIYPKEIGVIIEFNLDNSEFCNKFKEDLFSNPNPNQISFIKNSPLNVYLSTHDSYILVPIKDTNIINKICSENVSFGVMDSDNNFVCHIS